MCTVNAAGRCLNGNVNPPACSLGANWWVGAFGSCELGCTAAARRRVVGCIRGDGVTVADDLCTGSKPPSQEACTYENRGSAADDVVFLDERQLSPRGEFALGAGAGSDTYFISTQYASRGTFTITDPHNDGQNWIQLASGLQASAFALTANTLLLTLSNGVEVVIAGADRFRYAAGGRPGWRHESLSYADFVRQRLGVTDVLQPSTVIRRSGLSGLSFGVNVPCVDL